MKHGERNPDEARRESGVPGGGAGRRDEVRGSGVYPASAGSAPADAVVRSWAGTVQGDRGAAGYDDSGGSEMTFTDQELRAAREGRPLRQQGGTGGRAAGSGGDPRR